MSNPMILLETSSGDMLLELFADKAPLTVANFLSYVDDEFYTNTIFHRVIPDFMIQGGGISVRMETKPTKAPIQNEATNGLKNLRGTVAMARETNPHSAAAQFFINVVDNEELDHADTTEEGYGYCVFGQVVEGMNVAEKIRKLKTKAQGEHTNLPLDMVVITGVSRFE